MAKSVRLVSGYSNPRLWHNLSQDSSFHQNLPMRRIDSVFADLRCTNGIWIKWCFFLGERGKPYVHEKEASLCKLKKVKPQHSLGSSPGQICERRALSISFLTCKTKRTWKGQNSSLSTKVLCYCFCKIATFKTTLSLVKPSSLWHAG